MRSKRLFTNLWLTCFFLWGGLMSYAQQLNFPEKRNYNYNVSSEDSIERYAELERAKEKSKIIDSPNSSAKGYNSMGRSFFLKGQYDSSLIYYNRVLSFFEKTNAQQAHYKEAILANSSLGMIYSKLQDTSKSLYHFQEAYELAVQYKDTLMQMPALLNLGNFYYSQQNFRQAKEIYYQVLSTDFSNKEKHLPNIYSMLASVLWNSEPDSLEKSLYFAHESYKYALKSKNYNNIVQTLYKLGYAYLRNQQPQLAEKYLLKGLEIAEEQDIKDNKQFAYRYLEELYISTDNYPKAYTYQQKYYALNDSINGVEVIGKVAHIEQQYKAAEKELKITQLNKKLLQKNIWIGTIAAGAVVLSLILIFMFLHMRRRQQLALQQKEMNQLKAMMKGEEQERTRIARELHDGIGGMIAVIKMNVGSAMKEHPEVSKKIDLPMIDQLLENTSDEVRKTAHNLMPDVLTKYGLVEAVTLYCQQINNGGALFIEQQFHGDLSFLDKATELILYRIIQELIQNTLKHAHATQAELQVIRHGNTLHLSLEDNGSGFDPKSHSSGFGLGNLRFRVQSLHGKLEIISSLGQPTTVHIEFDIQKIIKYSTK